MADNPIKTTIKAQTIRAILEDAPTIVVSKIPSTIPIPTPKTILSISVNGEPLPIINNNVDIPVPYYIGGEGIVISDQYVISLDQLLIDCGTSTAVL